MPQNKALDKFQHPVESGASQLGSLIGIISDKEVLVGESAALFKQANEFSLVSTEGLLVMRYPVSSLMQAWPIETQRKLRSQCLEKYKWIYTRQQRLMQQLNEKNENILESAKKITDNTDKYYPIANDRTKEKFVEFTMN